MLSLQLHTASKPENTPPIWDMHDIHALVLFGPEFFISQG